MYEHGIDAMGLAFREGQRSVAIWLTEVVMAALENPEMTPNESTEGLPLEDSK